MQAVTSLSDVTLQTAAGVRIPFGSDAVHFVKANCGAVNIALLYPTTKSQAAGLKATEVSELRESMLTSLKPGLGVYWTHTVKVATDGITFLTLEIGDKPVDFNVSIVEVVLSDATAFAVMPYLSPNTKEWAARLDASDRERAEILISKHFPDGAAVNWQRR